jgi:hypothetical protein
VHAVILYKITCNSTRGARTGISINSLQRTAERAELLAGWLKSAVYATQVLDHREEGAHGKLESRSHGIIKGAEDSCSRIRADYCRHLTVGGVLRVSYRTGLVPAEAAPRLLACASSKRYDAGAAAACEVPCAAAVAAL